MEAAAVLQPFVMSPAEIYNWSVSLVVQTQNRSKGQDNFHIWGDG